MTVPDEFDLRNPLPQGLAVLEASAGTGKTYAIAGLVVRYVAEGRRLPRLLVVTFTRAATGELRERVRLRLVETAEHLERVIAGAAGSRTGDAVLDVVADGSQEEVARRHQRLVAALTDFDAATIATIHGFCQQVLAGVGLAGDVDRDAEVGADRGELLRSVVDDVVVARFAAGGEPRMTHRQVLALAAAVTANRDAALLPERTDDPHVQLGLDLAVQVRAELERRKRARRVLDYDDLLERLAGVLADPHTGPMARARLRRQYELALVDEFQDTDPVQWEILRLLFGGTGLVLIGDPKQAIYSFRGADVHAYLAAAAKATQRSTLAVNWRSDAPLLHACNVLFERAPLGDPRIAYRPVRAAPAHDRARLVGAPGPALRLRVLRRDAVRSLNRWGGVAPGAGREHIALDVAAEAVRLLSSGAELIDRDAEGAERGRRELRPGDLAVLVKANADAARVQRALSGVGVRSVINGVGSVFSTVAAMTWLRLLDALERPSDPGLAAGVALSDFVGIPAEELAQWGEQTREEMTRLLHEWAGVLRDRGVDSLLRTVAVQRQLAARLLAVEGGERRLTDLQHVGELLHAAFVADDLGANALTGWLRERIEQADDDLESEERARRLESDEDAVQILTVHRSKGLEFPVVYLPFLWTAPPSVRKPPVFTLDGQRTIDLGSPDEKSHKRVAAKQARGEDLRLLYVAVTRAKHAAVLWWAPSSKEAPLTRLLFCRHPDGRVVGCDDAHPGTDDQAQERLEAMEALSDGHLSVERVDASPPTARWKVGVPPAPSLARARFERTIDRRWRRTSYTALTAAEGGHGSGAGPAETDEPATDDEGLPDTGSAGSTDGVPPPGDGGTTLEDRLRATAESLPGLPGGTAAGTLVHGVLEHLDFAGPDLDAELRRVVDEQLQRRPVPGTDPAALATGLCAVLETPLGPLAGEVRLRDVGRADRLDELAFELPLAGGDTARVIDVAVGQIGAVLREHLSATDPLAGYAEQLAAGFGGRVRGFLTGSIDCVLRLHDGNGGTRYAVVDYKTNRLGPPGQPLTAWHYRPDALAAGMARGHYPLQALLYAVALQRYLRWRLPGVPPPAPLVLYAFVRGMTGADGPRVDGAPCGVFAWQPPPALVSDLSTLLDRGTP